MVTLAHAKTPQGPVAISLYRARLCGHMSLCTMQQPQGNGACATYPIGPKSKYQDIGTAPMWLLAGGHGSCKPPRFQVITGIVLRTGLTAWLRTPQGLSRMATAGAPKAFGVTGPVIYAVLTEGPDTIMLRDAQDKTVYSTPAVSGPSTPAYCGGLNPDTTSG